MQGRRAIHRNLADLAGLRVGLYCRVSQDRLGTERSVDDQEAEGRAWAARVGAVVVDVYRDSDRSASRYATKAREGSRPWWPTSRPASSTWSGSGS